MTATISGPVLILGATSDIGWAIAQHYAQAGRPLLLAARNPERLEADAADLRIRWGADVRVADFDVLDVGGHSAFLDGLEELPATVVCVVGLLGSQPDAERDFTAARRVIDSNLTGPASILGEVANRMEARGSGTIIGISSVAGDRGRASNYIYGAAKAGFTAFLSGLRNRLAKRGVHVVTVKPGFVRTRMTEGMSLPARLTAEPNEVARAILAAEARGRDIVYVRPVWWVIMLVIRSLPEKIFKRTKL
ncbi:SDR family oxidoreductase [Azospirillum sp. SYSU D00513]|uniref:SDR family oxidoreductase n=1 Tax=Azospirillum sp. SYSU D00513 TaxID=2812561 RepID=UPI001A9585D7|nr:SDR family oxidoreductase [Azospirillum sp. SYSU D00513]